MKNKLKISGLLLAGIVIFSGCSTLSSDEEQYNLGYEKGYADGLKIDSCESQVKEVKVSGDFTATVRDLIPDYCYDSETIRAAVVTLFQSGPFVLQLDEEICSELKIGETYTFILEEQDVCLPSEMLWDGGSVGYDAIKLGKISVTDFRTPNEDEYGLECWRINYS